jgi:excisionase family DNA binding protein
MSNMGNEESRALWKVKELAAVLGMTPQTMYAWIGAGKVTHLRTPGGRIRVPAAEVERLVSLVVGEISDSPLT